MRPAGACTMTWDRKRTAGTGFAGPMCYLHDPGVIVFGAIVKARRSGERWRQQGRTRLIDVGRRLVAQNAPTPA